MRAMIRAYPRTLAYSLSVLALSMLAEKVW